MKKRPFPSCSTRSLDTLDVAGRVVTIDAIADQQPLVTNRVARGADYVIALKKNQKHLFEPVSERLLAQAPHWPARTGQPIPGARWAMAGANAERCVSVRT